MNEEKNAESLDNTGSQDANSEPPNMNEATTNQASGIEKSLKNEAKQFQ